MLGGTRACVFGASGGGAAPPAFALDAHSFTNVNTVADPWTTPTHTFNALANLIIARVSYEEAMTVTSITVDPAGSAITLGNIVEGTAVSSLNSSRIWGVYSATPFGLSGSKSITIEFSGNASGTVGISSYIAASMLPTVFDFENGGGSSVTSLTLSLAVAGGLEYGHVLAMTSCNGVITVTPGGAGFSQQHTNASAAGGQHNVFSHKAGSLTNPEAPSFGYSISIRASAAGVLVI